MIPISYAGRKMKIDVDIGAHLRSGIGRCLIGLLWMGGGGCIFVDVVLVSGVWGGYDYE